MSMAEISNNDERYYAPATDNLRAPQLIYTGEALRRSPEAQLHQPASASAIFDRDRKAPWPCWPNAPRVNRGRRGASDTNTATTAAPLRIDAKAADALLSMSQQRLWVLSNYLAIPSFKIGKSHRNRPDEPRAWVRGGCPAEGDAGGRAAGEHQARVGAMVVARPDCTGEARPRCRRSWFAE